MNCASWRCKEPATVDPEKHAKIDGQPAHPECAMYESELRREHGPITEDFFRRPDA